MMEYSPKASRMIPVASWPLVATIVVTGASKTTSNDTYKNLLRRPPTIDRNCRAGDLVGAWRTEKQRQLAELLD